MPLIDAAAAIPVAFLLGLAAILLARKARASGLPARSAASAAARLALAGKMLGLIGIALALRRRDRGRLLRACSTRSRRLVAHSALQSARMFEIGTSLREARLRQGIELVEAEQATKIRAKYLRALEDERFELLPAQTYVKGFLRSYADYLGLDGQLYVDEYNSRYHRRRGSDAAHPATLDAVEGAPARRVERRC